MKVSVIVPVFRVPGDMLEDCLEALERQTVHDLEILCVLDGPDDAARNILEKRHRDDSRIRILQSATNRGVSSARNLGLSEAQGDWLAFVDADDRVEPTMLEELLAAAGAEGAELAACTWRHDPSLPGEEAGSAGDVETLDSGRPADWIRAVHLLRNGSCCGRLFSRAEFGDLRFDENLRHGEDLVFLQRALARTRRIAWVPRPLYVYRVRGESASRRALSADSFKNWLSALETRLILARQQSGMPRAARVILVWDTWLALNDPRPRKGWTEEEGHTAWAALRRFAAVVEEDFRMLPADFRWVWRRETASLRAFLDRSHWLNAWLWRRARRFLATLPGGSPVTRPRLYSAAPWGSVTGGPLCALDHLSFLSEDYDGTLVLCQHGPIEDKAAEAGIPVWCSPLFTGRRHAGALALPGTLLGMALRRLRYVRDLSRLLRRSPGIFHIHGRDVHMPYAMLAARLAGVPVLMTLHETWIGTFTEWWHLVLMRLFRIPVVCLSKAMVEQYPRLLPAKTVIPNAVRFFPPWPVPQAAARRTPVVGMVGSMVPEKGVSLALEVVRRLREKGLEFGLRLIGHWKDDAFLRESEAFVAAHGLARCVEFAGELRSPEEIYRDMDILFLPTRRDSFPRVIMEAMSWGIPAVATRVDGIPEMVEEGATGLLAAPGDTRGFAAALERLLEDAALRGEMGRKARKRAERLFSPKAYRASFKSFYATLPAVRKAAVRGGGTGAA